MTGGHPASPSPIGRERQSGCPPRPGRGRFEPSKIIFIGLACATLLATMFYLGMQAGVEHNAAFRFTTALSTTIERSSSVTAGEFVSALRARPAHFLQSGRYLGRRCDRERSLERSERPHSDFRLLQGPLSLREVIYGGKPGQELLSVIRGKVDLTPGGGLLITEAQGGRVRETDGNGKLLWEYVNRYDEEIAEIGEARL